MLINMIFSINTTSIVTIRATICAYKCHFGPGKPINPIPNIPYGKNCLYPQEIALMSCFFKPIILVGTGITVYELVRPLQEILGVLLRTELKGTVPRTLKVQEDRGMLTRDKETYEKHLTNSCRDITCRKGIKLAVDL